MDALDAPRQERDALASQLVTLVETLFMSETSRTDTVALESTRTSHLKKIFR